MTRSLSLVRDSALRLLVALCVLASILATSAPAADAADPEDRVVAILDGAATNGTVGVYLREMGGAEIAGFNESFVFEPASTIKALIHFHAMRQVQDVPGTTLTTNVAWFGGPATYSNSPPPGTSCPDNSTLPGNETLQQGLSQMMGPSDNRRTQAMRDFFGDPNIDVTRAGFGMTNSALIHTIGCGAAAVANPNQLTLVDAGLMYESVATGFLDAPTRTSAYSLMTQDNGTFNNMIDAELASLGGGLLGSSIGNFKAQRSSANKAGSYGLSTGQYRSVAGSVQVPWKNTTTCEVDIREYVYGAFVDGADAIVAGFNIRATGAEVLREEINTALQTWISCEADLQITSTVVVDPPPSIAANTPTVLTVRVAMRNNGPADVIDGVLTRSTSIAADCTINPANAETAVPAMAEGVVVVLEMDFVVECAQPSFHQFNFDSSIAPAVAEVIESDLSNNSGTTQSTIPVLAFADLATLDADLAELDAATISDLLIGKDFLFAVDATFFNFGDTVDGLYFDPADATATRSVAVPDGVRAIVEVTTSEGTADITISVPGDPDIVQFGQLPGTIVQVDGPATVSVAFGIDMFAVGEDRTITEDFGLRCMAPGQHDVIFTNTIVANDIHLLDPNEANNTFAQSRDIECITPVQINIRPGNTHNFVNPAGNQKIPIAVLTTSAGEYGLPLAFDATTIDHATARFGTADTVNDGFGSEHSPAKDFIKDAHELDDHTKDGDDDRILHHRVTGSGIDGTTVEACIVGSYLGANAMTYTFLGCDVVDPQ